ncbi:MAG: 4-hydroxy-tetrahydrodipicolinate reductase [Candidatus Margulisiibacteriota bacterium]|jgi:4-hydroxy-tetrahydrodipicolinate reductase
MSKIKVIVNGAKGKMGDETVKAVGKEPELELIAALDAGDDLAGKIISSKADVVVDFTHPGSVLANIKIILASKAHAVIGTTGLAADDLKIIESLCKANNVNCLVAPNFAIGAVLMMQFAKEASKYMKDVEIIEFHHAQKVDKPSGTAIKTAQMIKEVTKTDVPTHSVRLPGLVAHQEVIFGGLGQTLTIRHDTINREAFMPGVIMAIKKIGGANGFVYGLENLF